MKINYTDILNKNMINVFKDVLLNIKKNGLQENHHLYITFQTDNSKVVIPKWLKDKYLNEMTIVIQYEYWNFEIKKNSFNIGLSFEGIKTELEIPFSSVISFADPHANFGLRLISDTLNIQKKNIKKLNKKQKKEKKEKKDKDDVKKDNIINFKNFKKTKI